MIGSQLIQREKFLRSGDYKRHQLPFLPALVMALTTISIAAGGFLIFGYSMRGYSWVLILLVSLAILLVSKEQMLFPLWIWIPWALLLGGYLFLFGYHADALQRTVIILTPLVAAAAASKLSVGPKAVESFRRNYHWMAAAIMAIIVIRSGMLMTGTLPEFSGLAAESMTISLLAVFFAVDFARGNKRALFYWLAISIFPVITVSRSGIVATLLTLPLAVYPMKMKTRASLLGAVAVLAVLAFGAGSIQKEMFYSGKGRLTDLSLSNPDVNTSGRIYIWEVMKKEIGKNLWFGHGANANAEFIYRVIGVRIHPHNDWARILFDYGLFGLLIFILSYGGLITHIMFRAADSEGEAKVLFYIAATTFIPFFLYMLADNIILYVSYYGNFQFMIIGFAYAAGREKDTESPPPVSPGGRMVRLWLRFRW